MGRARRAIADPDCMESIRCSVPELWQIRPIASWPIGRSLPIRGLKAAACILSYTSPASRTRQELLGSVPKGPKDRPAGNRMAKADCQDRIQYAAVTLRERFLDSP